MNQPLDLEALKAKYAKATQGDWYYVNYADTWFCIQDGPRYSHADLLKARTDESFDGYDPKMAVTRKQAEANAEFVVSSHNAFPDLIAELERLTARVREGGADE